MCPLPPCSLLVGFAAYFVIGALVMKFYYKAKGSDIIPNKNFWIDFPLLIQVSKLDFAS